MVLKIDWFKGNVWGDSLFCGSSIQGWGTMSNQDLKASQILAKYRELKELFRKLKTSGFHWENTHMTTF